MTNPLGKRWVKSHTQHRGPVTGWHVFPVSNDQLGKLKFTKNLGGGFLNDEESYVNVFPN